MADDNILLVDEPKVEEAKIEETKPEETKTEPEEKEPEISLEDPVIEQPSIEEIKAKYPNILKDFPQLRKVIFRDLEYAKLFPTVAEAKEAVENNESFETVRQQVLSGDMESFLDSVKDAKALDKVAENFLPALKKTSSDAYDRIVSPLIQDVLTAAYNNARASGNKSLENSSLHLANFLFGESGSLKTENPKKEETRENPERNYQAQKAIDFSEDVISSASEQLRAAVVDGLTGLTDEQKDWIVEKTIKEIGVKLENSNHLAYMNSFWKSAGNAGYPSSHKPRIVSAYLARAKPLIPAIRNKFRATFNGKTSSEELRPDLGSGRVTEGSKGPKDPKSIDWRQTSDADFIEGRIKYKK